MLAWITNLGMGGSPAEGSSGSPWYYYLQIYAVVNE